MRYLFISFILAFLFLACEKEQGCKESYALSEDIVALNPFVTSRLLPYQESPTLVFMDSTGHRDTFFQIESSVKIERATGTMSSFSCPDGFEAPWYYLREVLSYTFFSEQNDSIVITTYPSLSRHSLGEDYEIVQESVFFHDRMDIRIYSSECGLTRKFAQKVYDREAGSFSMFLSRVEFEQFGVRYDNRLFFPEFHPFITLNIWHGLIGYRVCDKDYIRILN